MRFHSVLVLCLSCCLCLLQACSTLPTRQAVTSSYSTQINTQDSYLAQLFEPLKAQYPGKTGFHVLYNPPQALETRLQLINEAQKTLDLQYYIWDNDKVGALALAAILRAADRGVKVRLLIDDNNSKGLESTYLALSQHPNIQVRVFNPYRFRKMRALDILLDYNRITRRMHNKTFIADHQVALIGGRNMSNQYYDVGESFQFSDMDVVLVGSAVDDIRHSFDEYWNHEYAYPITQVAKYNPQRLSYKGLRQQLAKHWENMHLDNDLTQDLNHQSFEHWFKQDLNLDWVNATVIKDSANKINKEIPREQHLSFQMKNIFNHPQSHVDLVSAYFVPDKDARQVIKALTNEGVQIRVLTNSFKANDVPVVHAFYAKHRRELLEDNVQLYEFLPVLPSTLDSGHRTRLFGTQKFNRKGFSRSSLHAKFMALDNRQVFIGSFNFDPRSVYLNTEIGVILDSPGLASVINENMDKDLLKYSFQVKLDSQNRIIWTTETPSGLKTYYHEPYLKWWQKIALKLMAILPIEGQM
ncbi:phospholipase D family protein [Acinetobacter qingfengensis]|uniref:Phospholipase n=1 Tax=Acinetobacter qingfengensis TaxID=1262585 RepID=A0A1E7RFT2_9GAMM|nr:phospholipase D family protein [Acinetobacter qingfengensis]KAA8731872.1 phospholipase D family protein [Acinetobacter qingfengensis]OEY98005.1 phospholipase [Acinetobacter qingfengensis]